MNKNIIKQGKSFSQQVKTRKRSVVLLCLGLLLCGFLYFFWQFLQQPVVGTITTEKAQKKDDGDQKKPILYQGKYLTFMYPSIYEEKAHEIPIKSPVKESIFLSAKDFEGQKIAIVAEERARGDMESSPSFQMRVDKPEYDQEPVAIGWLSGFLFKKNSPVFEQTFFSHGTDFVVSISMTSPLSMDGLEQDLFALIASIRFRE